MRVKFRHPVGEFEEWTEEGAQSFVGQTFVAKIGDYPEGVGVVVAAGLVEDGRAIELTVEWP